MNYMMFSTKLANVYDKIWVSPQNLAYHLKTVKTNFAHFNSREPVICMVSGGWDPPHFGHFRYIRDAANQGDLLVVVVNGDGFLRRKKGRPVMPLNERMEMMAHLEGVAAVVPWDDGTQLVDGIIRLLRPHKFCKGGDRSELAKIANEEIAACNEVGCQIVLGVGGREKIQSSSWLAETIRAGVNTTTSNQ